jgi:hypothetical protein
MQTSKSSRRREIIAMFIAAPTGIVIAALIVALAEIIH